MASASDAPRFAGAAALGLMFRPIIDTDMPFLTRLYGSIRAHELAPVPWSEAEKAQK